MSGELSDARVDDDAAPAIAPDDVAVFLMQNPTFFNEHPDVLDCVELPDRFSTTGAGVVDFQRYQLERRDSEIDELRTCAQGVIETSRTNMSVQTRTHAAVLAMLHASTLPQLYHIVCDFEPADDTNVATLSEHLRALPAGTVDSIIGQDQDVQLYREFWDDGTVFGSAAGLVKSAAISRIKPVVTMPTGLIALGTRDETFRPGQGTELFSFLARVIEACVMKFSTQAK